MCKVWPEIIIDLVLALRSRWSLIFAIALTRVLVAEMEVRLVSNSSPIYSLFVRIIALVRYVPRRLVIPMGLLIMPQQK